MSEPPAKDTSPPSADDAVEELLAQCLTAADAEAALAAAAAAHPEHAAALRAGFALLCRAGLAEAPRADRPERLGRFRLLRELGGGGMGVVHLAEEEPLGRRVALKRVRPELLHFPGARQRFLREIAAVASLQHPGIVPIYSYGEEDGVPFYAMELVAGASLAEVLGAQRRTGRPAATALRQPSHDWTEACFGIASQLADALAHAHERGIVHRDVKPSNVMLADDGRALLIDFGLARVAGDESLTKSGVQPGSLAYMSPEQVRGEEIDARTDIWSLGVTLYEMLTLRSPFAGANEELTRQHILHGAAPDVRRSGTGVPWDAAVVLNTAMAPERERRYTTMRDFAADLRAFVEHRPIQARRPSTLLRLRRYAQRRPAVATGLVLGMLLLTTSPTALYLAERSARTAVQREADTARAAVTFLEDLFAECEPQRARGATVPARTILDRGVLRVRSELRDQPGVQAALLEAMGSAYLNLGLFAEASPLLADAQRLREAQGGTAAEIDRVLQLQARLASARGDDATAETLWRRVVQPLPAMTGAAGLAAAEANLQLAYALWRQDRVDDAEALTTAALATLRRLLPPADARIGKAALAYGLFLQERDDPLRAEPLLTEAEHILATALPEDHPDVIAARCDLARNARVLGKLPRATALLAAAEKAAVKLFDARHPQLAMVREELASLATVDDRPREAVPLLDQALTTYRAIYPAPNHVLARAVNLQSSLCTALGDLKAAEAASREALGMYEQLYPNGHLDMAAALCNLAMVQTEVGDLDEAIRLARSSLAMQDRIGQRNTAIRAITAAHLGYALAFSGEFAEAEQHARAAVDLVTRIQIEPQVQMRVRCYLAEVLCLQRRGQDAGSVVAALIAANPEPGPTWRGWALFLQGWAQELQRDYPHAETSLRDSLALRQQTHGARHPLTGIVLGELGVVLANLRRLDEAATMLAEAVAIRREHGGPDDVHLNLPLLNFATVRMLQKRPEEAAAAAAECMHNLRGKARPGHPVANGTTKLLLSLWARLPDLTQRRARLAELQQFADGVLLPDDPLREQLASAVEEAGG